LRGLPEEGCCDTPMCAVDQPHKFEKGKLYNLEASQFICKMEGAAGAHNDIGGQQVAHAIWDAVIAAA